MKTTLSALLAFSASLAVSAAPLKWIDGKELPLEGKAFTNTAAFYDRLPANVTTNVNGGVRGMKNHSSGMQFRFITDSKKLSFKWKVLKSSLQMWHMASTGVSGIDVYKQLPDGTWRYCKTGRVGGNREGTLDVAWTPGTACLVNLPLYNGIESFSLGIDADAAVKPLPPRKSGITKPVVFYGTSITHGACASRPGMAFVNIVGRRLDVPVVNLGFSGSGKMELEMSEHLAKIDASCYVLDCLANMHDKKTMDRYEPFIRNLRALRPDIPIIMAAHADVYGGRFTAKNESVHKLYQTLKSEGWQNLFWLPADEMYTNDGEGTVDGTHPNDWGMMHTADAFGKAVKEALKLK